jgi:4-hydroxy-tetrahydrodipicolinate reductase
MYRIAQCYTGPVGSDVIRRLSGHPTLRLIGVLVHSPEKVGLDSGVLVGASPNRVMTTGSLDEILGLKPDAIIWSGSTHPVDVFERILESGINLYTGIVGHFLEGNPHEERLTSAALRGGVSICASGNIPGLISDALPLFLSGYTGRIRQIRMWQRNDMAAGPSAAQIAGLGVGYPPGKGEMVNYINAAWLELMEQSSRMVAAGLGVPFEGITLENVEYAVTPEDFVLPGSGLEIKKGTAAGIRWTLVARAGGRDFFRLVNEQSTRLDHGPDWRKSLDEPAWRVEIDGDPPMVCTLGWQGSADPGAATHSLNAARAINIMPRLIEARPGAVSILDFPVPVATDG